MKKIILTCIVCTIACLANAQVTIGSDKTPLAGVLLQLDQNLPTGTGGGVTATKGLLLPRVEIKSETVLTSTIGTLGTGETAADYTGLIVFHVKGTALPALQSGIYVWKGDKWEKLIEN
ncbi:hypothetical protein M2459_002731 [Parabacteroides sp. PF5-5]|uniref:hypothetical protein n=1 Tax=unclassified Parabacteroides TaxID=2649774 RepID=UPI0024755763|nr:MULTISPECIES: hypothetical protein [unclassified Parabacteroides]MDH6306125.1 hypothetical protein [Parabacteroides sp. PH5-39]MDH6316977.1 hypothetical protein [Parabacteroides sp. PF5-13]MDH6320730.1 hypothetical protein [Parabacteroides sp. PH5-13]MDH6324568.1 hypothetical protein [Parabacteroides sp. PH5-8]MDH6328162.1 hypothetical protein [Parabacteroides sp. PH5-41]